MYDDIQAQDTLTLEREARLLELKLLLDASSAIETERYCLIQMELGRRMARELALDPRD